MTPIEESIRKIVCQVVDERLQQGPNLKSIADTCEKFGLSRTSVWRGIKTGQIKSTTIGSRVLVDWSSLGK